MIHIDRGPIPATVRAYGMRVVKNAAGELVTRAERESERAEIFFTDPANYANDRKVSRDAFDFVVYKDRELSRELDRVFGTKCAYCESDFGAVTSDDVEHFRPKSEINTGSADLAPGYYWLANDWTNLLVSCPFCNRGQYFEVPGQPGTVKLGKSTQFPLANESARYRGRGPGVGGEEPFRLLLDPCTDEPADHLTFDDNALILPRRDSADTPSTKGATSIFVYALQRKGLVEARKACLLRFQLLVDELHRNVRQVNELKAIGVPDALLELPLASISAEKRELKAMLGPRAVYLGMLRDWIRREKAAGSFADLEQFGIDLESLI